MIALGWQFALGYRPFFNNPERVAFSWDMFSNRVERCTVQWTPPLQNEGWPIASLRDLVLPFEWDLVFDRVDDYKIVGKYLCSRWKTGQTRVNLKCFRQEGVVDFHEFNCD